MVEAEDNVNECKSINECSMIGMISMIRLMVKETATVKC